MWTRTLFTCLCIFKLATSQLIPTSPCPDVFSYEFDGSRWYGIVKVSDPSAYIGTVPLKITLTTDSPLRNRSTGAVELNEPHDIVLQRIEKNLPVEYIVTFPEAASLPRVLAIVLRDNEICTGSEPEGITKYDLNHLYILPGNISDGARANRRTRASVECGLPDNLYLNPSIVNGKKVHRQEFPWVVAILLTVRQNNRERKIYSCAGSLISKNRIITAGHCVSPAYKSMYTLKFGAENVLNDNEPYTQVSGVRSVSVHPDYTDDPKSNDIALVVASTNVRFTSYVRPVCLWNGDSNQNYLVRESGIVIGWGETESGNVDTSAPRSVSVPIVSKIQCRGTRQDFYPITSDTTLCAGELRGSGPCRGDSGGGLYIKNGRNWYLRGIVSVSLKNENADIPYYCDLHAYVVYADAAKYYDWIVPLL